MRRTLLRTAVAIGVLGGTILLTEAPASAGTSPNLLIIDLRAEPAGCVTARVPDLTGLANEREQADALVVSICGLSR